MTLVIICPFMSYGSVVGSPSSLTSRESVAPPLPPIVGGPLGNGNGDDDSSIASDASQDLLVESNVDDAPPPLVNGDDAPPQGEQGDAEGRPQLAVGNRESAVHEQRRLELEGFDEAFDPNVTSRNTTYSLTEQLQHFLNGRQISRQIQAAVEIVLLMSAGMVI